MIYTILYNIDSFKEMNNPRVNVSEIANFIRMTRWGKADIADTFENVWKRTHPQSYQSSRKRQAVQEINQYIRDNALQPIVVSTDTRMTAEEVPQLEAEYNNIVDHVEKRKKTELVRDIVEIEKKVKAGKITQDEKESITTALLADSKLDTTNISPDMEIDQIIANVEVVQLENREEINKHYGGVSRQTLGICEELTVASLYNEETGRTIEDNNSQIFRKNYKTRKGRIFQVSGMVDGFSQLNGEQSLIEIKNRTKRLFNFIPNYEKIQTHFYMAMTQTTQGELVERFGDEIKIHPFFFEKPFYKETLKSLSRHVDFLVEFLENSEQVEEYKKMTYQERCKYLNSCLAKI